MRISELIVIAVLTGTLGLMGCGDDTSTTPDGSGGAGGGGMLEACGAGESLDESFETDEGIATCDGLGVLDVPIILVLAAKPAGDIDGAVDFEVQAQFILDEPTVAAIGSLVQNATVSEVLAEVADTQGNDPVDVPATVPCTVDFSEDTDDNGMPGPVVVTTPVLAGAWTAVDGSIVLEAAELIFDITAPVPLSLSTMGENPTCIWDSIPTITFPPVAQ